MENHLEVQPKIQPFHYLGSTFIFFCTILHTPGPSHLHIHKECNPAISLKTKCQSHFSSRGSAVMACDKVIQAWYDFKTWDLSWQPWVMLALVLQASPDRRIQASPWVLPDIHCSCLPLPLPFLELPVPLACSVCKSVFSSCPNLNPALQVDQSSGLLSSQKHLKCSCFFRDCSPQQSQSFVLSLILLSFLF